MSATSLEHLNVIQTAMLKQRLHSECKRLLVFIGLLGFLLLVLLTLRNLPSLTREDLRPQLFSTLPPIAIVIGAYLAYEICVLAWLNRLLRADRLPPAFFQYINALVEVSMPTAAMLAGAPFMGGLPMVAGAVPFVYFLFLCLAALNLNFRLCLFAGVVAGVEYLATSLVLLRQDPTAAGVESPLLAMFRSPHQYVIRSAFLLMGGFIAGFVALQIKRQLMGALQMVQERDRAISIFGQHVSPQVAELLLHQPMDSAGEERRVCVMFLDIRDFSRIASARSPTEVMDYLNTLFGFMIPVINDHRGIVNKFLGDGFMAVFGAPVADAALCQHAVEAAQVILRRVDELNASQKIPPTRLGIGLHLGLALTGNVGGADRKEYTVIGDAVNLTARIEQATKQFQAQLIISEDVARSLDGSAGEDLGLVELKGQAKPVRLFKLA
jgi:adenylate cyclase